MRIRTPQVIGNVHEMTSTMKGEGNAVENKNNDDDDEDWNALR